MTVRSCSLLAAALGAWLANPLPQSATAQEGAGEPARFGVPSGQALPPRPELSPNQQLANAIADQLRQSGQLRHYRVDLAVVGGAVEVTGQVTGQAQRDEVLRIVQGVPGVATVRDRLEVRAGGPVVRTQATTQPVLQEPGPLPGKGAEKIAPPPPAGTPPPEPTPIFHAPPGLPYASLNPPPLPPYAWPTFAPYNNYSRVATPTLYPYKAWPYIGPMYPFPKVPLGWRSIQLEYNSGHWWYGKRANGHDWWRVRYW